MAEHRVVRYATPSLWARRASYGSQWDVSAYPWHVPVGLVKQHDAGWTAHTTNGRYAGLWPTKQAAAEVLVKQAGYEVGEL